MTTAAVKRVVLAAGGTGGHMFPAQALAHELVARGVETVLVTDRRGGGFGPDLPQVEALRIAAGGVTGTGLPRRVLGVLRLGIGLIQAWRLLRHLHADSVIGFGGYASVPTVLAAAHLGLRIVLHEQNAVLGRANKLLARRAGAIATSFDRVDGIAETDTGKVRVTGNPVRPAIAAIGRRAYALPVGVDRLRLLVVGGSQGAVVFNDVVPDAICRLPPALRERIEISQQVRGPGLPEIAARYGACGVACELKPFFKDVAARLAAAHLVVCRAGASTVAELAAAGRPGLLVPYPAAIDDHQTVNAERLVEAGGGWLLRQSSLTADSLADRLQALLTNPALLVRAARCARAYAHEDAALGLADLVCAVDGNGGADRTRGEAA